MSAAPVIDCDVHCAIPSPSVLYPYLSDMWCEHIKLNAFKGSAAIGNTYPAWNPSVRTDGAELTLDRLQADVLDGVELAILYCYYGVESLSHPYFAAALATAVNRWLEDEWLSRDDRLRGSAVVTPQYPDAAVAEIERIGSDSRFAQILVPAGAAPGYGHPSYWPIWKAAARNGLAVAITYGGSTGSPPTTANWLGSFWEEYNTAILNVQSHVMSLAVSGIFTEVPDLRFVVAEGGWTWLPPFFWRLDHEWKSFQREVPWMKDRPPSAWVRDHFRFTTQPFDAPATAAHLQDLLEQVGGVGMLMFGSDYPHTTGHPNDQLLDTLGADDADNVRHANAAAWYSF